MNASARAVAQISPTVSCLRCASNLAVMTRSKSKPADMILPDANKEPSDALVLFGVTGDLGYKKIFPALYAMVKRGELDVPIVGDASSKWDVAQLHERATNSIS